MCVLNQTAAARLFPLATPQGKTVRVRGHYYRVIGIIEDDTQRTAPEGAAAASGGAGSGTLAQLIMPYSTLMDQYGDTFFRQRSGSFEAEKVEFHEVIVRVEKLENVVKCAEAIKHILSRNHPKEDYRVTVPIELLRQAVQRRRDELRRDLQQLDGSLPEGLLRDEYMPVFDHFVQGKDDPRFDARGMVGR